MNKTITLMAAALAFAACTSGEPKELVLYYSQTGTTKAVAEEIAAQTGADLVAFDVTEPYTGDFNETIARCTEERTKGYVPELAALDIDLSEYDVIYLGYPIWFGSYAPPVEALLKVVDLGGKTIVPFCTFGSGGLQASVADLKKALPKAEVREGYGVRTARVQSAAVEVPRFLAAGGYIEGEVEVLPDFSEQKPVTEEEAAIFDTACSSYQFPLGTPVTCGSRTAPEGTEYLFMAENAAAGGASSTSKIYVIANRTDGGQPEFTMVDR
ncbi:MAG: flavodoxin [Bacteroidia bacterium]|nr:flavodoxin [Bacteroidia bacterium]